MKKKHKEDILRLRSEGKLYNQICEELGCSKGTVSYHCSAERNKENSTNIEEFLNLKGSVIFEELGDYSTLTEYLSIAWAARSFGRFLYAFF